MANTTSSQVKKKDARTRLPLRIDPHKFRQFKALLVAVENNKAMNTKIVELIDLYNEITLEKYPKYKIQD